MKLSFHEQAQRKHKTLTQLVDDLLLCSSSDVMCAEGMEVNKTFEQ